MDKVATMAVFLRKFNDEIVGKWLGLVERRKPAPTKSLDVINHVPEMLDRLAAAIERQDETPTALSDLPATHAEQRFRLGYSIIEVIEEYRLLRKVILDTYVERGVDVERETVTRIPALNMVNGAIDRAIAEAADRYTVERERSRDIILGVLGHDLRNPLAVIALSAQAMSTYESVDAFVVRHSLRVAANAERMSNMIEVLLDFTKARMAGGIPIEPALTDIRPILATLVREVQDVNPEREVIFIAPPNGNFVCTWDSDRIVQAVTNLTINALRHGKDPIEIGLFDYDDHVSIEVSNSGTIPEEVVKQMFEPFYSNRPPEQRQSSLGLGLYIVAEIARSHRGTIELIRNDGHDITFKLCLPRNPS